MVPYLQQTGSGSGDTVSESRRRKGLRKLFILNQPSLKYPAVSYKCVEFVAAPPFAFSRTVPNKRGYVMKLEVLQICFIKGIYFEFSFFDHFFPMSIVGV